MLSFVAATFFVNQAMTFSLVSGLVGLIVAILLIRGIFVAPSGNDKMRAILVDWLVEVHLKFKVRSHL